VTWKVGLEDQPGGFAITQTVPLTPTTAKPLATFANNDVAATEVKLGNGRAITFWVESKGSGPIPLRFFAVCWVRWRFES
jgi:hypothetical protein